ncbi:hypothetical protein FB451DRAFT_1468430 [Mycena latifolia]|nr:hypothetical protein FB451DRAFT_1468430 [Mycena latifolia]
MSTSTQLAGEAKRQANFLPCRAIYPFSIESGVLCSQFINYFIWYRDDKTSLKVVVAILCFLTVLKSIQAFAIVWIQFIVFFGDLQGAILLNYTTWWQSGNPLIVSRQSFMHFVYYMDDYKVAVMGLYVQCYFCFRLYIISGTPYVVAPVAAVFLFALVSILVATYYITAENGPMISNWFAAHLSSVFAGDILLSATTAHFLLRSRNEVLPQTVSLMSALVRLTFQTAALPALCAMFNLIFSQLYPASDALISTAFNMALPKLYAVSMMWTLNARRAIRAMYMDSNDISIPTGLSRRTNGDVELSPLNLTQIDNVEDLRALFGHADARRAAKSQEF